MKGRKISNRPDALKFSKIKELIHPLLLKAFSSKTTGNLIVDGQLPNCDNYLIVANHLCIEDIPTLAQAVKKHFYLLVSDEDKGTIDGIGLSLNGVEWVHRLDKESRQTAFKNGVEILKRGEIFAMYPEATWNLSPNALIMDMNYGCIRMALEAGVPLLPVVSFFFGEERHTKIGNLYYPSSDLKKSIGELRDIMATLVFCEIEENYERNYNKNESIMCSKEDGKNSYYEKRSNIPDNYWDEYVSKKYDAYERARSDKNGVREFESQFIFTPKTVEYQFFQEFNSVTTENEGKYIIRRITSEKKGYEGFSFGEEEEKESFGFGYNEKVLKKELKR